MSAPPIVTFYHTSRLFNEVENACSVYLCCARIDWLIKLRFERKELCKTLKMKHANRPLLNFRVCQVEMCILDFEGSQCSVKSYANSHDGRMFFFSTQMLYAAPNLNAPFPFSFTRIEWVNCFLKERSCVEQNETREQSLAEFRVCQAVDVYSRWYSLWLANLNAAETSIDVFYSFCKPRN